jgi:hypothetical protein
VVFQQEKEEKIIFPYHQNNFRKYGFLNIFSKYVFFATLQIENGYASIK